MRKLLLALMLLGSVARAERDLTPSLGLTYSRLDLSNATYATTNLFQTYYTQSVTVDLRWPVCQWLDINIGGGPSVMSYSTWNTSYFPTTWILNGNTITPYGSSTITSRQETLNGYNFAASVRWYIK